MDRERGEGRRHQAERHEQPRLLRPLDGRHHHNVEQYQHGDQSTLTACARHIPILPDDRRPTRWAHMVSQVIADAEASCRGRESWRQCGMSLTLRAATVDDAAGLLDVLNPIIEARCYTVLDTPFTLDEERAFVASFPPRGVLHVAEQGDEIVGFQSVEPFASYTHAFDHLGVIGTFVRLDSRRQGVGRALFAATLAAARDLGYEKLSTFIRADNHAALAAYASQGFRKIGVASRHAKIDGVYIDEVMVERAL